MTHPDRRNRCADCNDIISNTAVRCRSCASIARGTPAPTPEEIAERKAEIKKEWEGKPAMTPYLNQLPIKVCKVHS